MSPTTVTSTRPCTGTDYGSRTATTARTTRRRRSRSARPSPTRCTCPTPDPANAGSLTVTRRGAKWGWVGASVAPLGDGVPVAQFLRAPPGRLVVRGPVAGAGEPPTAPAAPDWLDRPAGSTVADEEQE